MWIMIASPHPAWGQQNMDSKSVLQGVPLFSALNDRQVGQLATFAHPRTYAAGEVIVKEGEEGIGLFVITSGEVEVTQNRAGRDERLRSMSAGNWFGELALLSGQRRTATVRSTTPVECLVLTSLNFNEALDHSPEMMRQLLKTMGQWLAEAEQFKQRA